MTQPYPLGEPSVSGNEITVDLMLQEPTRINRYLSDLTLKGYFADRIFPASGGVSGGAVVYTQLTENALFVKDGDDVRKIEPGAEYPLVGFDRPEPKTAQVEKFGGRFFVTDEARDRNDATMMRQGVQRLANTITKKIHARALSELSAEFTALGSDAQTHGGNDWSTVTTAGTSASNATKYPAADFAKVQLIADKKELGVTFDTWIVNPQEASNFHIIYGNAWQQVLADNGIQFVVTNQVTAGTAYAIESGQVGQMRLEQPLNTVTYREDATDRTWVQSGVRPVFVVTNPFSIAKVTGLAG